MWSSREVLDYTFMCEIINYDIINTIINRIMPTVWGKNTGKWASYQTQQNQNRAVYADHVIQQERITQGCQTINKSNNVASINSGSIVAALKEGSQDYTCAEKTECLLRTSCPLPPPPPPPAPYVPGPGQANWANIIRPNSITNNSLYSDMVSVTTDLQGNVYTSGRFNTVADLSSFPVSNYNGTSGNVIDLVSSSVTPITSSTFAFNNYIVKYDKDGIAQWAVTIEGNQTGTPPGTSIVTDNSGNVYIFTIISRSGVTNVYHMSGGVRTIYGTILTASPATNDMILVKYDSNGTAQGVSIFTSAFTSANESISSLGRFIAYDSSTNSIALAFNSSATSVQPVSIFNGATPASPGGSITFGAAALTVSNDTFCSQYGIIVKMNTSLNVTNATKITTTGTSTFATGLTRLIAISIDISGNIICIGEFSTAFGSITNRIYTGTAPPSSPTVLWGTYTPTANQDVFIVKYNSSLTPLAYTVVNNALAIASEFAYNLITDYSGNIYVFVQSRLTSSVVLRLNNASGGGGGSAITLTPFGTFNSTSTTDRPIAALIKYPPNLTLLPNSICGTIINYDSINYSPGSGAIPNGALAIDNNNNIYITINFFMKYVINNATLAPGGGSNIPVTSYANVTNITPVIASIANNNVLLVKYDSNLQAQWATTLNPGINLSSDAFALTYDSITNSVYIVGSFDSRNGGLTINNYDSISSGNLNTTFYATLPQNTSFTNTSSALRSGFIVQYVA